MYWNAYKGTKELKENNVSKLVLKFNHFNDLLGILNHVFSIVLRAWESLSWLSLTCIKAV